ncbi:MAG: WD40 repeat domain-containing protein [Acidobacteriota bacterium]|jgi:WD40 repeat protein
MTSSPIATARVPETAADRFVRHRGPVTSVAGVPGRRAALSAAYDSAVAWVDLDAGTFELLGYHDHLVNAVVVDPSGSRAASCSSDYTVCLWDLGSRLPERVLRGHGDDVNDFTFVGERLGASVSHDQRVYVWDLETGAVVRILEGHEKYAMSVDAAAGRIYSAGDDMTLRQWDAATGRPLRVWGPFEVETDTCAIDPLHARVVLGADDGCVRIFDSESGDLVREIPAHGSGIKKVAVSPATGHVLSAAYDQRLLVWDPESFERVAELRPHRAVWERSLSWAPDGGRVLAGTFDGTVVEWDAATGELLAEVGVGDPPGNLCFNEVSVGSAGDLALVSDDGLVRRARLTPDTAELGARVEPASGRVLMNGVFFDGEGNRVLAGAHDQKLHVFSAAAGGLREELEVRLDEGPINCVRVSHHSDAPGAAFVGCYSGAVVRVSQEGEVEGRFRHNDGAVKALALHPEKPLGVSCSADGGTASWTLNGELVERFPGHVAIADDIDLDPTGERLVTVSRDFTLQVYEVAGARLLASRSLGRRSPKSVCFWDRETVIVGNYWGELLRFELGTGRTDRVRIADNGLSSLGRSGEHLVASSYDGSIYLVRPGDLAVVHRLQGMVQKVGRSLLEGGS